MDESVKIFLEWERDQGMESILYPNSSNGTITIQDNDSEYSYTSTYRIGTDLHFCRGYGGLGEDILPSFRGNCSRDLYHCEG